MKCPHKLLILGFRLIITLEKQNINGPPMTIGSHYENYSLSRNGCPQGYLQLMRIR